MNDPTDYDYPTLSHLYETRSLGIDMRELLARTHSTLLARVQSQLDALKARMLELEDSTSQEFKTVHTRARVLGSLFAEIDGVLIDARAADAMLAEHDAGQTKEGEEG